MDAIQFDILSLDGNNKMARAGPCRVYRDIVIIFVNTGDQSNRGDGYVSWDGRFTLHVELPFERADEPINAADRNLDAQFGRSLPGPEWPCWPKILARAPRKDIHAIDQLMRKMTFRTQKTFRNMAIVLDAIASGAKKRCLSSYVPQRHLDTFKEFAAIFNVAIGVHDHARVMLSVCRICYQSPCRDYCYADYRMNTPDKTTKVIKTYRADRGLIEIRGWLIPPVLPQPIFEEVIEHYRAW